MGKVSVDFREELILVLRQHKITRETSVPNDWGEPFDLALSTCTASPICKKKRVMRVLIDSCVYYLHLGSESLPSVNSGAIVGRAGTSNGRCRKTRNA